MCCGGCLVALSANPGDTRAIPRSAVAPLVRVALLLWAAVGPQAHAQPAVARPLDAAIARLNDEFTLISSIRELTDGRTLVADYRERRLLVVDWQQATSTPIGRVGDGPGEYRNVFQLHELSDDSTLLTDGSSRRWFVLSGATIVETIAAHLALNQLLGPTLSGADRFGHVLGLVGHHWSTPQPVRDVMSADSTLALLGHRSSARIDTIASLRGRGERWEALANRRGTRRTIAANPLPTTDQIMLFADGWIAIALSNPYSVNWRGPQGQVVSGPALPFETAKVDEREKCAALERETRSRSNFECEPMAVHSWPAVLPPFLPGALLPLPDGRLAIARTPSASSRERFYDIVDRRGALSARVSVKPNERIIGFGARSAYVVESDENDIQRLRRHPWP